MGERNSVERASASLIRELMRVEEEGVHGTWGAAPEGEPQIWWRHPQALSAKAPESAVKSRSESLKAVPAPRKRSLTGPRASISSRRSSKESAVEEEKAEVDRTAFATPRPTGVPLEAFATEVMPAARWELFEQRTEPHFRVFVQVGQDF